MWRRIASTELHLARIVPTSAAQRFAPPDALVVGTGLACQVGHIVTNDQSWKGKLATMSSRIGVVRTSDHLPFA